MDGNLATKKERYNSQDEYEKSKKFTIGSFIHDKDMALCKITNFIYGNASSSIEVFIEAKSKKGISCAQWFTEKEFEDRFIAKHETTQA